MNMVIVTEELSKACGGIALSFAGTALGTLPIILSGSEEQKKRWLPDIAAGKQLAAFALTEPQAGSDAGAVRTTAIRDGDHYVLNGTKQWITNGGEAEIYSVIALTNPAKGPRGASCIVVEKGTPGFTFGKKEDKLGIRASATRELIFQDCRVPVENCLGREGTGFITAMKTFDVSRPGVGAQAVGIAQGAFDLALEYACTRRQFGSPVGSFQGLRFMLADMATKIEAARALVYATARYIDTQPKERPTLYSAMSQVLRLRRGHGSHRRRRADLRRLRLHARLPDREVHARRQDHPDLRRHQPDPARGDVQDADQRLPFEPPRQRCPGRVGKAEIRN